MNPSPTPSSPSDQSHTSFQNLVTIMSQLRGPDGCPWDREQSSESLKPYLVEEVYEVLEAIDEGDPSALKEELGDLLLQIVFHAQIASEHDRFTLDEVVQDLNDKLIRRHPHVFEATQASAVKTATDVSRQWDQLKQQENTKKQEQPSLLQGIPKHSPALQRAYQVQKRASRGGFDWKTIEPALEKFKEELDELYSAAADSSGEQAPSAMDASSQEHIEAELGDVLFALVNVSRFLCINPEEALRRATNKFIRRFHFVESQAASEGKALSDYTLTQLDQWWEEAKFQERQPSSPLDKGNNGITT